MWDGFVYLWGAVFFALGVAVSHLVTLVGAAL